MVTHLCQIQPYGVNIDMHQYEHDNWEFVLNYERDCGRLWRLVMFVFKYTGLSLKLIWSIPVATLISTNPEVSMRKFELSLLDKLRGAKHFLKADLNYCNVQCKSHSGHHYNINHVFRHIGLGRYRFIKNGTLG